MELDLYYNAKFEYSFNINDIFITNDDFIFREVVDCLPAKIYDAYKSKRIDLGFRRENKKVFLWEKQIESKTGRFYKIHINQKYQGEFWYGGYEKESVVDAAKKNFLQPGAKDFLIYQNGSDIYFTFKNIGSNKNKTQVIKTETKKEIFTHPMISYE